jgi:hypothetical protein
MNIMPGIIRFSSLAEAVRQGYEVCGQTDTGYLLRIMTARGWAMALCARRLDPNLTQCVADRRTETRRADRHGV